MDTNQKEVLHFGIDPRFITDLVRSWFWQEGKSWATVEEVLLECLKGTNQSREELVTIAKKIVFGELQLIPSEDGKVAMLAPDTKDLVIQNVAAMFAKITKLEKSLKESQEALNNLLDRIEDNDIFIPAASVVDEEEEAEGDEKPGPLSYLPDDYGWLSPTGEFFQEEFGGHDAWAMRRVGQDPELNKLAQHREDWPRCNWGDVLCSRGWILLHNPGFGMALVTRDESRRITKAQSEFLYGYYMDRGYEREAQKYME